MRLKPSLASKTVTAQLVTDYAGATRVVGEKWQYVFVLLIALGVAWLTLSNVPRRRAWVLIGLLLVELFSLAWVCSLYRVFFQPTPSILALVFAFLAAEGVVGFFTQEPLTSDPHIVCRPRFHRPISAS